MEVVPLGFRMMECFLRAGFINKEIIIKKQHNCKSTGYWGKNRIIIFCFLHMSIYLSLRNNGSIWDLHGVKVLIVIFCVRKYNKFMGFCHLVTRRRGIKMSNCSVAPFVKCR